MSIPLTESIPGSAIAERRAEVEAIRSKIPAGCETCPKMTECHELIDYNLSIPTRCNMDTARLVVETAVKLRAKCNDQPEQTRRLGFKVLRCTGL